MININKALAISMAIAMTACSGGNGVKYLIKENVEVASVQLKSLAEASEPEGKVLIPSTYKGNKIAFTSKADWVSGFFAGTMWEMYALTGDESWVNHAKAQTLNIEEIKFLTSHHDIGFMINSSFGAGLEYAPQFVDCQAYKDVIVQSAKSLCTRFRPGAGIIQSWNTAGWQGERGWTCPVIIDNMMNLELLFKASEFSGDKTFYNVAVSHADKTMENHFRPDYSSFHVIDYDPETGEVRHRNTAQGYADETAWARGQAWGLYGYTMCYRFTKDQRYLDMAENIAKFVYSHKNMPEDLVPYWDYDCPDIPNTKRDVSSATIMASALCELYSITGKKEYLERVDKTIESLSSPAYRAEIGANGGFLLMHSVGSIPHNSNIDVPLNYADYYFLETLLRRKNLK